MGRAELLEAVQGGLSVSEACRRLEIPRQTAYGWRLADPAFKQALTDALAANKRPRLRVLPGAGTSAGELPDRAELLDRLNAQSAAGSVRATEILIREMRDGAASAKQRETADRLLGIVR